MMPVGVNPSPVHAIGGPISLFIHYFKFESALIHPFSLHDGAPSLAMPGTLSSFLAECTQTGHSEDPYNKLIHCLVLASLTQIASLNCNNGHCDVKMRDSSAWAL